MPSTFNFPLTTLTVGSHDIGPASVPDGDTKITITNDRTVTGGMNAQPATTTISWELLGSNNGGATWQAMAGGTVIGGFISGKSGIGQINIDQIITTLNPGTSRQVKATLAVLGTSVAVQGSIATQ